MKRLVSIVICLVVILSISVAAFAANPSGSPATKYVVSGDGVRVHRSANSTNDAIGQLYKGDFFWVDEIGNPRYGGFPDTATDIFAVFGCIHGYVDSSMLIYIG